MPRPPHSLSIHILRFWALKPQHSKFASEFAETEVSTKRDKKCSGNKTNNGDTSDLLVTLLTLHWREEKYQKDENIRYLWAETLAVYLNTLISVMAVVVAVFCKMVNG